MKNIIFMLSLSLTINFISFSQDEFRDYYNVSYRKNKGFSDNVKIIKTKSYVKNNEYDTKELTKTNSNKLFSILVFSKDGNIIKQIDNDDEYYYEYDKIGRKTQSKHFNSKSKKTIFYKNVFIGDTAYYYQIKNGKKHLEGKEFYHETKLDSSYTFLNDTIINIYKRFYRKSASSDKNER